MKNQHREEINNILLWLDSDQPAQYTTTLDIMDILSNPDPIPRDILLGFLFTHPDRMTLALKDLPTDQGEHLLNLANFTLILHLFNGWETEECWQRAESYQHDGIPGTTLLEMLKTSYEDDDSDTKSVLYGLFLNSMEIAAEQGLEVFQDSSTLLAM